MTASSTLWGETKSAIFLESINQLLWCQINSFIISKIVKNVHHSPLKQKKCYLSAQQSKTQKYSLDNDTKDRKLANPQIEETGNIISLPIVFFFPED